MSKERWATRIGVILAVAGSAIGLGNFLRFPGQAAQNGGGVFMIPYFCALLLLGIPICWAEWIMGKYGGRYGFNSAPAIFAVLGRRPVWRYVGVLGVVVPVIVYTYYVLIESWCLSYAWAYLSGSLDLGPDHARHADRSKSFFTSVTGAGENGLMFEGRLHESVVMWLIVFGINFWFLYRGLSAGIERLCRWAVPLMAVCALFVLVRVLTLGTPDPELPERSLVNGLGYMWNPKPVGGAESWIEALAEPRIWLAAAGQIFFSLSVGFGIIINFSSYLRPKDDVVLSGLTASATNEFFEVCMGGLITIPAAFMFLGALGASATGTFDLGFKTLPIVFAHMPGGRLFGFIWFLMLFLAAITSSLSMLQPAVAFLEEAIGVRRQAAAAILGVITGLGSLIVIYFSRDLVALSTLDDWVGTNLIVLLALAQVLLFGWVFGAERGFRFAQHGAKLKLPRLFVYAIKYVAPLYLLFVLGSWMYRDLPRKLQALRESPAALVAMGLILVTLAFFLLLAHTAGGRWQAESAVLPPHETESSDKGST